MKSSFAIVFVLLLLGCSAERIQEKYFFDFPSDMRVLGHKGSGTHGAFGNTFRDNSVAGIVHAIEQLDGAEVDIQMSADSTLWLFHDHVILNCGGALENIALLSDTTILRYSRCSYGGEISPLSSLTDTLRNNSFSGKVVSLDLKVLQNPESIRQFGGKAELALFVAERINTLLLEKHNYQVFIEVPYSSQVDIMESITGKTTFLIHNSFEYLRQSFRMNHSAPIHHFYTDVPELFESYGQKSLLWVVNSAEEMMNALALRPTAIQTDNISMVQFFRALPVKGEVNETFRIAPPEDKNDYLMINEFMGPFEQDVLFEIDLGTQHLEAVQVVFSAFDEQGISTKWEALPYYKNIVHFFQGAEEHANLQTKSYKLYLWQPEGKAINLKQPIELRLIKLE